MRKQKCKPSEKQIIIGSHALGRSTERNISINEIIEVIRKGRIGFTQDGRYEYYSNGIRIIAEHHYDKIIVITATWENYINHSIQALKERYDLSNKKAIKIARAM